MGNLVLTRRVGESFMIQTTADGVITVTLTHVEGTQARLGVKAPKRVPIWREEIFKRIEKEHKEHEEEVNGNV